MIFVLINSEQKGYCMKKILVAAPLFLLLSACATGYHSVGLSGGFDEFKLSNDSYIVRFSGNGFTSGDRAYKYAIRRSAELTKEKGYKYFKIIKSSSVTDRSTYVTPLRANTQSNYNGYGGYGYGSVTGNSTTTITGGDVVTTERPSTSFAIKMYLNQVSGSFNADTILSNFDKK